MSVASATVATQVSKESKVVVVPKPATVVSAPFPPSNGNEFFHASFIGHPNFKVATLFNGLTFNKDVHKWHGVSFNFHSIAVIKAAVEDSVRKSDLNKALFSFTVYLQSGYVNSAWQLMKNMTLEDASPWTDGIAYIERAYVEFNKALRATASEEAAANASAKGKIDHGDDEEKDEEGERTETDIDDNDEEEEKKEVMKKSPHKARRKESVAPMYCKRALEIYYDTIRTITLMPKSRAFVSAADHGMACADIIFDSMKLPTKTTTVTTATTSTSSTLSIKVIHESIIYVVLTLVL